MSMRQLKITTQITNRDSYSLEKYLTEIARVGLIEPDEEVRLAGRIKEGDLEAMEILVKANLRFVVSVAKQYQNQGLSLSDLINEGNLGLIKAAAKFDETKGFKFISYAVWWIRQSIMQCLVEQSRIVRLPLNKVGSFKKINSAFARFEQEFEREPSSQELADILDITSLEVSSLMASASKHVSMDASINGDEEDSITLLDTTLGSTVAEADDILHRESLKKEIGDALGILGERECKIVSMYYGLETGRSMTLEEIGTKLKLTRERVRQIKERALRRLRKISGSQELKTYLGYDA